MTFLKRIINRLEIRSVGHERQSDIADCGIACLASVFAFYDYHISIRELKDKYLVSNRGLDARDLSSIAFNYEFNCKIYKCNLRSLKQFKEPTILHWNNKHFVVMEKVDYKGRLHIFDPAKGRYKLPFDQAIELFSGYAISVKPSPGFQKRDKKKKFSLRELFSSIRGLRKSLTLVLSLTALTQVFTLISPYYIQLVTDKFISSESLYILYILIISFSAVLFFEVISSFLRSLTIIQIGAQVSSQISVNIFTHLLKLPQIFFDRRHLGDIVNRFNSIEVLKDFLTSSLVEGIVDGTLSFLILIILFSYDPTIGSVILSFALINALQKYFLFKRHREFNKSELESSALEGSSFMEAIRGIQTIKVMGGEPLKIDQWTDHLVGNINNNLKVGLLNIVFRQFTRLIFGIENLIVVGLAAVNVIEAEFTIGMLVAITAYKQFFRDSFVNFIEKVIELQVVWVHLERLDDIISSKQDSRHSNKNSVTIKKLGGSVEFRDLTFRYADNLPNIFSNLSFTIADNEVVAIVAPSGFGKTTLLKLALGLLKPTEGQVLFGGISVSRLDSKTFSDNVTAVMQDDRLFSGSLRDNISFFQQLPDEDDLIRAAKQANIYDDIMNMPMGFDTYVGDMGASLSGGQVQRVLIARALYKKPRIIIMDEATSHLDTRSEHIINENIRALSITRIIVAHRDTTINMADRVIDLTKMQ